MEKRKLFKYFYITTLFILLAIGAYPLYCGMRMIINSISEKSLYIYIDYIDKAGIVPFTAITLSIIIGFAILPILQKVKINFSIIAGIIISSIIFVIVEIFVENMATIQGFNERIMLTRFMPPEEYFMSVADGIPLYIKIHYYIFSLLLVIISIMFLYNLSQWFIFGAKKTITKRALVLQGITVMLYTIVCIFGAVVAYENFGNRSITSISALNVSFCIIVASTAAGLFSGSFLSLKGVKKYIPSFISMGTAILLYFAEYFMLQGQLYLLGTGFIFSPIPLIGVSFADIIIILVPSILVYIGLYLSAYLDRSTHELLN